MKFTVAIASIAVALAISKTVEAAECSKVYGQCGGEGWKGPTCCESGSYCHNNPDNKYYSQCLPGSQNNNSTTKKPQTTTTKAASTTTTTKSSPSPSSPGNYKVIPNGASGNGKTTRYWDCCKSSCSWPGKASVSAPVDVCGKNGISLLDSNTQSGCNGGQGYMCNNNQPWAINDNLAYGFAAASIVGSSESGWCCSCYELTFTSGPVSGKKMVVQVTNTGGDLGNNHFDLQLPGGGVGVFNGCQSQWGAPSEGWGQRYGGVSSAAECSSLPSALQAGCKFRFNWFKNADNPTMTFKEVTCPSELTSRTGCSRR